MQHLGSVLCKLIVELPTTGEDGLASSESNVKKVECHDLAVVGVERLISLSVASQAFAAGSNLREECCYTLAPRSWALC